MSRHRTTLSRAFSLVEVLVAVLVLALGLLGLGAVFPVVVRQQRIATQTTLGLSAREATQQLLVNNDNFRSGGPGWGALRDYVVNNGGKTGAWVPIAPDDPATNNYVLPDPAGGPDVILPLSQRIYPLPFSSSTEPRFVWDMAARVSNSFVPTSPMLVAVFLRPIDPGIRPGLYKDVATGEMVPYSLVNSLIGGALPERDRRHPVSVDRDGRPTFDGRNDRAGGRYALPLVAEVSGAGVVPTHDQLFIERMLRQGTDVEVGADLLAQPGQKFIDRRGYVYTVTGSKIVGNKLRFVLFTPPLVDPDGDGSITDAEINPILFVPQPSPVDPIIFTINP